MAASAICREKSLKASMWGQMSRLLVLLAAFLFVTPTRADDPKPLTSEDKTFVIAVIATMRVVGDCPGYQVPPGALLKYGDSLGVDFYVIFRAVAEASLVDIGVDYDRSKLIPEVTRLVHRFNGLFTEQLKTEPSFCKEWSDYLTEPSLIEKKS
jgi:hypothetical protein